MLWAPIPSDSFIQFGIYLFLNLTLDKFAAESVSATTTAAKWVVPV